MRPEPPAADRDVFEIDVDLGGPVRNGLFRAARPVIERATGVHEVREVYRNIPPDTRGVEVMRWALDHLGVGVAVSDADLARIPAEGPAIVVCNHPFGAIEGIALAAILARRRDDFRILANFLLGRMPALSELFLFVDPFDREGSVRANLRGMRRALEWVRAGRLLATFPAGEVASFDLRRGRVVDPSWSPMIARLARQTGAPVVPLFFSGRNGALFQIAGLVHPTLRTALLPRQMVNKRGMTIDARVGNPIARSRLASFPDDAARIGYLRARTEILAERPGVPVGPPPVQPRQTPAGAEPLIEPIPPEELAAEVAALPAGAHAASGDGLDVYYAAAEQVPAVLREIGRLRERTFREVGEGTGRNVDLDRFDPHYVHLFVWNPATREIVGAYRLGRTDELLARFGPSGLYTSSLFEYRARLFTEMGPALEMGRSFIRSEYQRSFTGLLLLWKGIAAYVCRNPRYATLFGPVSISAEYRTASQRLMFAFLSQNRFVHEWSRWVRPRTPFEPGRRRGIRLTDLESLEDVSAFINEIEADAKGVPVLLKQYLKLGGRLLGFNVDPDFSGVLDVLLLVDLRRTDPRILARYMGREALRAFLDRHRDEGPQGLAG